MATRRSFTRSTAGCRELYQQPHTHRELVATINGWSLTIHAAITDFRTNMLLTDYQTATDTPTMVYVLTTRCHRCYEAHS